MNKLLISVDGVRRDRIAAYRPEAGRLTPNLSRIADASVVFDDAFAAATSTAMCFSTIFTGRYARELGRKTYGDNANPFDNNLFRDHERLGYRTICCLNRRFEEFVRMINAFSGADFLWLGEQPRDNSPGAKARASARPAEQAQRLTERLDRTEGPWLAWIHLWGFSGPEASFQGVSSFDYDCRVRELDAAIGTLYDAFADRAELFVFSDHGYAFFEHGYWSYGKNGHNLVGPVTDVPLLIHDGSHRGRNGNLVSTTHLRELVADPASSLTIADELAFCESRYLEQPDKALAIRRGRLKLIYHYDSGRHELYDLDTDPAETIDYAREPLHRVARDEHGNHPTLKPYIVRSDWEDLEANEAELIEIAKGFYPPPARQPPSRRYLGAARRRAGALKRRMGRATLRRP